MWVKRLWYQRPVDPVGLQAAQMIASADLANIQKHLNAHRQAMVESQIEAAESLAEQQVLTNIHAPDAYEAYWYPLIAMGVADPEVVAEMRDRELGTNRYYIGGPRTQYRPSHYSFFPGRRRWSSSAHSSQSMEFMREYIKEWGDPLLDQIVDILIQKKGVQPGG